MRLVGALSLVFISFFSLSVYGDVTGSFDIDITLEPMDKQAEAVKYFIDIQSNLQLNITLSGLTYGPDVGFGNTGIEFAVLNLDATLGALTLKNKVIFATPFVSLDLSNSPTSIVPTVDWFLNPNNEPIFVSYRSDVELNIGGVVFKNEAIFEDVDFHGPFNIPARNLDNGDQNGDGCPGVCGVDDDGDGLIDEGSINDDDEDGRVDEDPPGDANLDGCPGRCGVDDDGDGFVDLADPEVIACGAPCATADDDEDGVPDEDGGDALFDEDPFGDANGDGCPGICGVDDDNDGAIDEGSVNDDDEDGAIDEDFGKTVYFPFTLNFIAGDQTPSFGFGDRITISGQTVSGITVSSSAGFCFDSEPKTIKKRSFNGSVNPGCIGYLLPRIEQLIAFDFLTVKVQNISIGGIVLSATGEWKPLEASTLRLNGTMGLFGVGNLNVQFQTKQLTDLTVVPSLLLSFIGENLFLTLADTGADLEFESISLSANISLNSTGIPVNLFTTTAVTKDVGITSQSLTISVTRLPWRASATTSFFGSGTLSWQNTSFSVSSSFETFNLQSTFGFGPAGINTGKIELGFVF